jgi:hypothetical protein
MIHTSTIAASSRSMMFCLRAPQKSALMPGTQYKVLLPTSIGMTYIEISILIHSDQSNQDKEKLKSMVRRKFIEEERLFKSTLPG